MTVVDLAEIVRGELAENADRKDFLPSEIEAIRRALLPKEKEAAKERALRQITPVFSMTRRRCAREYLARRQLPVPELKAAPVK